MTPFRSALGNVIFNLISLAFLVALFLLYGKFAPLLAYGAILSQRYAIHCYVQRFGISLR